MVKIIIFLLGVVVGLNYLNYIYPPVVHNCVHYVAYEEGYIASEVELFIKYGLSCM